MRKEENLISYLDWPLFISFLLMLIMGLATVYSVAYTPEDPSLFDLDKQYGKQSIWIGISLFLGLLVFLIDSDIYRKFAFPIYLFTLLLLVIVLFMPAINGARAWIGIGSFGGQPSEFAKFATALAIAKFIGSVGFRMDNFRNQAILFGLMGLPMVLILLQKDTGTALVFACFCLSDSHI